MGKWPSGGTHRVMASFSGYIRERPRLRQIALVLIAAIFAVFMLRLFEHSQVYHPGRQMYAAHGDLGRPSEDIYFTCPDGTRLNAWYFPAETGSQRKQVILLCHGNGGNISHRLDMYEVLLRTGVAVFAFDYRGYGKSQGRPGEAGTYDDAEAAYHWLINRGYEPGQIITMGESLGGGVASELALRRPVAGLVLLSSFTCIPDIGAELFPWLPVRWIARIKYDTCSKLPRIDAPVLVMHSREDELISFEHGRRNFAAAKEPKLFHEIRGTHNEPLLDEAGFRAGIVNFLQMIESSGTPAASGDLPAPIIMEQPDQTTP
jgi:uncharacterized protein